eukprot:763131-Hanusia_phi.AAC.1
MPYLLAHILDSAPSSAPPLDSLLASIEETMGALGWREGTSSAGLELGKMSLSNEQKLQDVESFLCDGVVGERRGDAGEERVERGEEVRGEVRGEERGEERGGRSGKMIVRIGQELEEVGCGDQWAGDGGVSQRADVSARGELGGSLLEDDELTGGRSKQKLRLKSAGDGGGDSGGGPVVLGAATFAVGRADHQLVGGKAERGWREEERERRSHACSGEEDVE